MFNKLTPPARAKLIEFALFALAEFSVMVFMYALYAWRLSHPYLGM
jgi:hypothetical protein